MTRDGVSNSLTRSEETPRDVAFCAHAILGDDVFTVNDATQDERFRENPLVVGGPKIRFYAGAPVRSADGHTLGTLCVIDGQPREFTAGQKRSLATLARQIEAQLELRHTLREVVTLGMAVSKQRDVLTALQEQKRLLSALVVHDLKGPLSSLMADAEVLAETSDPKVVSEIAYSVLAAAEGMHRLTLDLLDISRSEAGELPVHVTRFDVIEMLVEVQRAARSRARSHGGNCDIHLDASSPAWISADRTLLKRLSENLVDNALKYGRNSPVEIRCSTEDGGLTLQVRDAGPGIPAESRSRVFEQYAQVSPTPDRSSHGLGLVFCRLAVEAHGGRIWIDDNTPRGCVFHAWLPCEPVRFTSAAHPGNAVVET